MVAISVSYEVPKITYKPLYGFGLVGWLVVGHASSCLYCYVDYRDWSYVDAHIVLRMTMLA